MQSWGRAWLRRARRLWVSCSEMAASRTVCGRTLSLRAALGNHCILPPQLNQGVLFRKPKIQLTHSAHASLTDVWNKISCTIQLFSTSHTTVDPKEMKKFQLMAHKWWDEDGDYSALHSMNDIRVPFIRDIVLNMRRDCPLGSPLSGMKILDVGCGGGLLTEPLGRLGASVTGIDPLEDNIRTAELHKSFDPVLAKRILYKSCSLEDLVEEASEIFDIIVASEVVEHVADVEMFVRCCSEVLKPDGCIFITTINKSQLSYILGIVVAEKILGIVPAGTHDWEKFISPEELERILESNGFSVQTVKGMLYNPLLGSWSWTGTTSVNYALHAVKCSVQEQSSPSESPLETDRQSTVPNGS
ncbi:ubiquinone biosynthesis O-methyltransferase, mitochondrial [Sphaerodactylus townsendi]|uniref:ubiquinone biosynthesis O-methyltransferase, mitochondrial n=1 Tax=Sphaerodactylus townsendi TaxID=933632 RepID=UPI002027559E|nr:ubiquinone biosynthesis O-methyltransferase, mitochondrial [Sphaerodactylus townsendi]